MDNLIPKILMYGLLPTSAAMVGMIVSRYRPMAPKFQDAIRRFAAGAAFTDGVLIGMRLTAIGRWNSSTLVIVSVALILGFIASTVNPENGNASTKALNMTVAITIVAAVGILAGRVSPRAPDLMMHGIYAVVVMLGPASGLFLVTQALFDETFAAPRVTSAAAMFFACLLVVLVFGSLV